MISNYTADPTIEMSLDRDDGSSHLKKKGKKKKKKAKKSDKKNPQH